MTYKKNQDVKWLPFILVISFIAVTKVVYSWVQTFHHQASGKNKNLTKQLYMRVETS